LKVHSTVCPTYLNHFHSFSSPHGDIPMTVKAMKSGAVEFLTKPFRRQDLLNAIQQALQGDQLSRRQRNDTAELQERYKGLTGRERKVMPIFCAMAPVKAPRSWPKSSLSSKSKGMAA
jgi:FixJ family two-component response regulator